MGPENAKEGTYWYAEVELPRPMVDGEIPDLTEEEADAMMNSAIEQMGAPVISYTRMNKHSRCKNRKRFVKLLMGQGTQRNTAEITALFARGMGIMYQEAWDFFWMMESMAAPGGRT